MVTSGATTPEEYIDELPRGRREAIRAVVQVIRRNLPEGYAEGMQHGMIAWFVPLERFPDTYNGQPLALAAVASQKNHMSIYLNDVYSDPATERWFRDALARTGKKLDMGKSCMRFRSLEQLPLEVIGAAIARADVDRFLERYRAVRGSSRKLRAAAR